MVLICFRFWLRFESHGFRIIRRLYLVNFVHHGGQPVSFSLPMRKFLLLVIIYAERIHLVVTIVSDLHFLSGTFSSCVEHHQARRVVNTIRLLNLAVSFWTFWNFTTHIFLFISNEPSLNILDHLIFINTGLLTLLISVKEFLNKWRIYFFSLLLPYWLLFLLFLRFWSFIDLNEYLTRLVVLLLHYLSMHSDLVSNFWLYISEINRCLRLVVFLSSVILLILGFDVMAVSNFLLLIFWLVFLVCSSLDQRIGKHIYIDYSVCLTVWSLCVF